MGALVRLREAQTRPPWQPAPGLTVVRTGAFASTTTREALLGRHMGELYPVLASAKGLKLSIPLGPLYHDDCGLYSVDPMTEWVTHVYIEEEK